MEATTIRPKPPEEPKISKEQSFWQAGPEAATREAQEAFDAAKRRLVETKNAQAALDRIDPKGLHEAIMEARPLAGILDMHHGPAVTPPSETLLKFAIALARRGMSIVLTPSKETGG